MILGRLVDGAGGGSAAPGESPRAAQQAADQASRTQSTRPVRGVRPRSSEPAQTRNSVVRI